jgi:creatinine amidohydrolase
LVATELERYTPRSRKRIGGGDSACRCNGAARPASRNRHGLRLGGSTLRRGVRTHKSSDVADQIVKEIGDWAYYSGVRRLFIVNTHVTNAAPLRCALEMLRSEHDDMMVALFDSAKLSARVRDAHFADGDDWHANDAETSLMMAAAPELVCMEAVPEADDPDRTDGLVFAHPVNRTSKNGVTGTPSKASKDKGGCLFEWMVEDLGALILRGLQETPPLGASYFQPA